MNPQTAETPPRKEVIFDDQGQTVEVRTEPDPVADEARAAAAAGEAPAGEEAVPAAKFRIGDQEFTTQDEALAYAQRQVEIDDAYRRGVTEAAALIPNAQPGVTPAPVPEENVEELYTNPQEFLKKYATKIKSEVLTEAQSRENMRAQSDSIWREFTDRHPALAEFRSEIEQFVNTHQGEVRAIIASRGRPASYDFIATKLRSRFESYANALKPKRELPNGGGGPTPSPKSAGVTPKPGEKKILSMADVVRSLKKGR